MEAEQLAGLGSSPETDSDKSISSHLSMALVQHGELLFIPTSQLSTKVGITNGLYIAVVVCYLEVIGFPAKHNIKCEIARIVA